MLRIHNFLNKFYDKNNCYSYLLFHRQYFETVSRNPADFLYEENNFLLPFRDQQLTSDLLTQWYAARACDIEENSRLVDHALEFVELGMKNNVEVKFY